jgi:hypothetical protein
MFSVRTRDMFAAALVGGFLIGGAGTAAAAGGALPTSAEAVDVLRSHGSLKVYDDAACDKGARRVSDAFSVGGRRFEPDQNFTLTFRSQPRGRSALTLTGTTSDEGWFCLGPQTLPEGRFLVTYVDDSGKRRDSRLFTVVPSKAEPSVPPVQPEPSVPPVQPKPSVPPVQPKPSVPPVQPKPSVPPVTRGPSTPPPSTPPATPEPSTPPATPEPSTPPARPQPPTPPARPKPFSPGTPVRTPQPQVPAPTSGEQSAARRPVAFAASGLIPSGSSSFGPTGGLTPSPTQSATGTTPVLGDDDLTSDAARRGFASNGEVAGTPVAVPVGLSERGLGGGASLWVLVPAVIGVLCAIAWCVAVARRED